MTRNLERRFEIALPILSEEIKEKLREHLKIMLSDDLKAKILGPDRKYHSKEIMNHINAQACLSENEE